jgi:alkanesulfonate monooxygenase SsuD/methylene tetrahydromethanopterin reductase-like flavin-dependent oxidoreductase (luciferase family)
MRLGLGPIRLDTIILAELRALGSQATASSFDCVWVSESRAAGAGGGLSAAALLAQAVPIRVGAAVDVGLYHPLHLAEDIAVADLTTSGRLEVILRLPAASSSQRYGVPAEAGWFEEHLSVLAAALSGAHVQWNGRHLRVPGRLDANQPVPERLALNPRPTQPAVPIWVEAVDARTAELAARLGFGAVAGWTAGAGVPAAVGRLPGALLCPADVAASELLAAAGDGAGYFIVDASSQASAASAGRRLAGPLRMPDFPPWVNA